MTDKTTLRAVLDTKMGPNDANADTVGEYLLKLAQLCWVEGEGFNGKRPFGNSGWESEIYNSLCAAGLMKGEKQGDYEEFPGNSWYDTTYDEERRIDGLVLEALQRVKLVVE